MNYENLPEDSNDDLTAEEIWNNYYKLDYSDYCAIILLCVIIFIIICAFLNRVN